MTCPGRRESVVVDHQLEVTEDLLVTCRAEVIEAGGVIPCEHRLGHGRPIDGADLVRAALDVDVPHFLVVAGHFLTSVVLCLFLSISSY